MRCASLSSVATRHSAVPSRVVRRSTTVVARTSKQDALRQLETFSAGFRASMLRAEEEIKAASRSSVVASAADASTSASSAVVQVAQSAGSLLEIDQTNFYEYLNSAGDELVVVDFYTTWCGPCKLILPQLVELAGELTGRARIVKFNCSASNKQLGQALGIRVAPTFHLYRGGEKVAEMTGAKVDKLKELISAHL